MKIGAYVTNHNNPMFLRLALLQLEAQTIRPNVIAVFQNGHKNDCSWVVDDIVDRMRTKGTEVIIHHEPNPLPASCWYLHPIQELFAAGCDTFIKTDHDDLYYDTHIETALLNLAEGYDFVVNKVADLVVMRSGENFRQARSFDFSVFNASGGCAPSFAFNRKFAEQYLLDLLAAAPSTADDNVLCGTMRGFRCKVYEHRTPTLCYVAHGKNCSTGWWYAAKALPPELKDAQ